MLQSAGSFYLSLPLFLYVFFFIARNAQWVAGNLQRDCHLFAFNRGIEFDGSIQIMCCKCTKKLGG